MFTLITIVTKSSNPLLVGSTGIVIQETQNLFKIITKENKVKCKNTFYIPCYVL